MKTVLVADDKLSHTGPVHVILNRYCHGKLCKRIVILLYCVAHLLLEKLAEMLARLPHIVMQRIMMMINCTMSYASICSSSKDIYLQPKNVECVWC